MHFLASFSYDVVTRDLMMPRVDGWTVLRQLRDRPERPRVLVLPARRQVEDRVEVLNLGADDFIVKPFAYAELLARLHALMRRGDSAPVLLKAGRLVVDPRARASPTSMARRWRCRRRSTRYWRCDRGAGEHPAHQAGAGRGGGDDRNAAGLRLCRGADRRLSGAGTFVAAGIDSALLQHNNPRAVRRAAPLRHLKSTNQGIWTSTLVATSTPASIGCRRRITSRTPAATACGRPTLSARKRPAHS